MNGLQIHTTRRPFTHLIFHTPLVVLKRQFAPHPAGTWLAPQVVLYPRHQILFFIQVVARAESKSQDLLIIPGRITICNLQTAATVMAKPQANPDGRFNTT